MAKKKDDFEVVESLTLNIEEFRRIVEIIDADVDDVDQYDKFEITFTRSRNKKAGILNLQMKVHGWMDEPVEYEDSFKVE